MTAQSPQTPPIPAIPARPSVRPALLALLLAVTVTGAAGLAAVYAAPESFEVPLAYGAGAAAVALCVTMVVAVRATTRARWLDAQLREARRESERLADDTLPALVRRLREGQSAQTALAAIGAPADEASGRVLRTVAEEVGHGETAKAAAMAACANAAGRMQALATGMLADLRDMEHRHGDETVLADLLHLDHRTAQAGRLADSIAVLTGARSGRRWAKPIVMESILRGAMGRIGGYQRVRLHSAVNVAVTGHAAEGVMHALAELLDNACNFSPPTAEVHVYVEEVPAGVIVTVEDSGLVMGEIALRRAERAVSRDHPLDLTTLSGTRLGLAVVGCLARKHGLSVTFRPSARGGTGALMMIPHELISRARPADEPAPRATRAPLDALAAGPGTPSAGTPHLGPSGLGPSAAGTPGQGTPSLGAPGSAVPLPTDDHSPASTASTEAPGAGSAPAHGSAGSADTGEGPALGPSGLPQRRRGRTLANAHPQGLPGKARGGRPESPAAAPRRRSPNRSAEQLRAFRQAVRGSTAEAPRNARDGGEAARASETMELAKVTDAGKGSEAADAATAAEASTSTAAGQAVRAAAEAPAAPAGSTGSDDTEHTGHTDHTDSADSARAGDDAGADEARPSPAAPGATASTSPATTALRSEEDDA